MISLRSLSEANWRVVNDYVELCKPKVVLLMILTAIVGMCLASPHFVGFDVLILGNIGIALVAGSAAVMNHMADVSIDRNMRRTRQRPIVVGKITVKESMIFALTMGVLGLFILSVFVNVLTAFLSFLSLICYAVFYTRYLKYATPQNIVIGGIAGAAPPLLGWTAVTNQLNAEALLLVLIIFVWTPPHFWALAIFRREDYAKAKVPMLPITHGVGFTKLNILLYTILLFIVTLLPFFIGMSGCVYLVGVSLINLRFLYWAVKLLRFSDDKNAIETFKFSIKYLGLLFLLLLADHYLQLVWSFA